MASPVCKVWDGSDNLILTCDTYNSSVARRAIVGALAKEVTRLLKGKPARAVRFQSEDGSGWAVALELKLMSAVATTGKPEVK